MKIFSKVILTLGMASFALSTPAAAPSDTKISVASLLGGSNQLSVSALLFISTLATKDWKIKTGNDLADEYIKKEFTGRLTWEAVKMLPGFQKTIAKIAKASGSQLSEEALMKAYEGLFKLIGKSFKIAAGCKTVIPFFKKLSNKARAVIAVMGALQFGASLGSSKITKAIGNCLVKQEVNENGKKEDAYGSTLLQIGMNYGCHQGIQSLFSFLAPLVCGLCLEDEKYETFMDSEEEQNKAFEATSFVNDNCELVDKLNDMRKIVSVFN